MDSLFTFSSNLNPAKVVVEHGSIRDYGDMLALADIWSVTGPLTVPPYPGIALADMVKMMVYNRAFGPLSKAGIPQWNITREICEAIRRKKRKAASEQEMP